MKYKSCYLLYICCVAVLSCVLSEIIISKVETIYYKSPKLIIRGTGFDADADKRDITLELGAVGQSLICNEDYKISKIRKDGITLELPPTKRWANLYEQTSPVHLILSAVRFGDSSENLINNPVTVALVMNVPYIYENERNIMSNTKELRVNGIGLIGSQKVYVYFEQKIRENVDFEDVTKYPMTNDELVLRLKQNFRWRDTAGPLVISGMESDAGSIKFNNFDGVKIANVVMAVEQIISVTPTVDSQLVYDGEGSIVVVTGTGFNRYGNTLRFYNGLSANVDYDTLQTTENHIKLQLRPGYGWCKSKNFPCKLIVLSINTGEGFVAVGPTNYGKGSEIATVFERPNVLDNNRRLFRTHSRELRIRGSGFSPTNSDYKTLVKFDPPLTQDVDYTIIVIDRTEIELTLVDGHAWRSEAGPLKITAINTRGDDAGWVTLPGGGVHIAEIEEDIDASLTGGFEIFHHVVYVFQSYMRQKIQISGSGFKEGMLLVFEPAITFEVDYILKVISSSIIILELNLDHKWRSEAGFLVVKSIIYEGNAFNLAGGEGIRVAKVRADPIIEILTIEGCTTPELRCIGSRCPEPCD